jgi:TRAP-type mannitol/chloroaromatic compound transport system substrate-binding protein
MRKSSIIIFALVLSCFLAWSGYDVQAAENYTLKIQTAVPSASIYFQLIERFAGRVDAMSAGRLKIEVLPAGAVVGVFEILDAVDKGIVNGGFAWTHYWSGKHPACCFRLRPPAWASGWTRSASCPGSMTAVAMSFINSSSPTS